MVDFGLCKVYSCGMDIENMTIGQAGLIASTVNGVSEPPKPQSPYIGRYVVVRTYSAGVHCGILVSHAEKQVVLREARRIWSWEGAFTLSQVATGGVHVAKLADAPEILLTEAIEIIPCTEGAQRCLKTMPEHRP